MAAGAAAGTAEHIAMYPVDTVKTRMQALAHPGQQLRGATLHRALRSIIRREGFLRLYHGVGAVAGSAGCAPPSEVAVGQQCRRWCSCLARTLRLQAGAGWAMRMAGCTRAEMVCS